MIASPHILHGKIKVVLPVISMMKGGIHILSAVHTVITAPITGRQKHRNGTARFLRDGISRDAENGGRTPYHKCSRLRLIGVKL